MIVDCPLVALNRTTTSKVLSIMAVKSNLFAFWKQKELERGERILISDVVRETGLQRNTIQNLLNASTTRFDAPVLKALCAFFDVPAGPVPFLVFEQDGAPE